MRSRHTNIAGSTGVVVSGQRGGSGRRRGSVAVGFVFQMFEDPSDVTRLGDEGDHAKFAAAGYCLVSASGELAEKLAVVEEVDSLWVMDVVTDASE